LFLTVSGQPETLMTEKSGSTPIMWSYLAIATFDKGNHPAFNLLWVSKNREHNWQSTLLPALDVNRTHRLL